MLEFCGIRSATPPPPFALHGVVDVAASLSPQRNIKALFIPRWSSHAAAAGVFSAPASPASKSSNNARVSKDAGGQPVYPRSAQLSTTGAAAASQPRVLFVLHCAFCASLLMNVALTWITLFVDSGSTDDLSALAVNPFHLPATSASSRTSALPPTGCLQSPALKPPMEANQAQSVKSP